MYQPGADTNEYVITRRKKMFALIKREIEDSMMFYLLAVLLAGLTAAFILMCTFYNESEELWRILFILFLVPLGAGLIGVSALGSSQMYSDRTKKISSFLSTLAVTRRRLFAAKVIAGWLVVFLLLVPVIIAAAIMVSRLIVPVPAVWEIFGDIALVILLVYFAGYSIGLLVGWNKGRSNPVWMVFVLLVIFLPFVLVKGLGAEAVVLLVLFNIASLIRGWQKFAKASF